MEDKDALRLGFKIRIRISQVGLHMQGICLGVLVHNKHSKTIKIESTANCNSKEM